MNHSLLYENCYNFVQRAILWVRKVEKMCRSDSSRIFCDDVFGLVKTKKIKSRKKNRFHFIKFRLRKTRKLESFFFAWEFPVVNLLYATKIVQKIWTGKLFGFNHKMRSTISNGSCAMNLAQKIFQWKTVLELLVIN